MKNTIRSAAVSLALAGTLIVSTPQAFTEETESEAPALAAVPSGTYVNDKTHTYVAFSYNHLGFSRPILRFSDVDATISLDKTNIDQSTINVEIDVTSIDTGVEELDDRLAKDDFFDFEQFPKAIFTSKNLSQQTATTGTIEGELTLKGVTKPVTLNVVLNGAMPHPRDQVATLGVSATTQIKRSEFDLGYLVPFISDEIDVQIEVEFNLEE